MHRIKLVLATNNAHKIEEIAHFFGNKFELFTLEQIAHFDEIDEPGATLEENSLFKAQYIFEKYGFNCLADDSGLEVEALNGQPGVFSARYAGPQRIHNDNMDLLIKNLNGKINRNAQFKTVITLIQKGTIEQFVGTVSGKIISEKRGNKGFGYDPIFIPDGFDKSFAEMTLMEKNSLSHRTRALVKMVNFLQNE